MAEALQEPIAELTLLAKVAVLELVA